jgi:hypothetical protein
MFLERFECGVDPALGGQRLGGVGVGHGVRC